MPGQEAWSFPLATGSLRTYFKTKWEQSLDESFDEGLYSQCEIMQL